MCKIPEKKTDKRILRKTSYRVTDKRTNMNLQELPLRGPKKPTTTAIGQYCPLCQKIWYNAAIAPKSHKVLKNELTNMPLFVKVSCHLDPRMQG